MTTPACAAPGVVQNFTSWVVHLMSQKQKRPAKPGVLTGKRGRLGRFNLKARVFDGLHHLLGRELVGSDGENLVGVGRIYLPVTSTGLLVKRGRNGLDAAAAIDIGLELKGVHESGT